MFSLRVLANNEHTSVATTTLLKAHNTNDYLPAYCLRQNEYGYTVTLYVRDSIGEQHNVSVIGMDSIDFLKIALEELSKDALQFWFNSEFAEVQNAEDQKRTARMFCGTDYDDACYRSEDSDED